MLELTRLWAKETRNGKPMLVGRLAGARIFVFELPESDERGATHVIKLADPDGSRSQGQQRK